VVSAGTTLPIHLLVLSIRNPEPGMALRSDPNSNGKP
jgi:hypothetical protein